MGQQLEGVGTLMDRYCKAGVRNISRDFYKGGRHEMVNELKYGEFRTNLMAWLSAVLGNQSPHKEPL